MKLLLFASLFCFCRVNAQEAKIIHLDEFRQLLNNDSGVHVINFWATWCKPCVKELPLLTSAEKKYSGKNVKFVFISLDFKRQLETLNSFLSKNNITSEVYLLDEPDYNNWINMADQSWEGNIPATLIYKKGGKRFIPHELQPGEIEKVIDSF